MLFDNIRNRDFVSIGCRALPAASKHLTLFVSKGVGPRSRAAPMQHQVLANTTTLTSPIPMPVRNVSKDLKDRIPILFYHGHYTAKEICCLLGVKKSLVYQSLQYYCHFGCAHNIYARTGGRPRTLNHGDLKYITALIRRRPCMYLDEIQDQLANSRGAAVSVTTIYQALRRMSYTRKRVSAVALERNEEARNVFMNQMADLVTNLDQLMFVDESARNRRTSARQWGWSLLGRKCVRRRFFVRGSVFLSSRYSPLRVCLYYSFCYLANRFLGIVTHDIIHGSVNSTRFFDFLQNQVIPVTNPYPGPRSILVLDNCSIHHAEAVRELVEDDAGCKLVYLPPYSPDFNPIEEAFSAIKAFLHHHCYDQLLSVMDRACHSITGTAAEGFFRSCGYVV